MIFIAANKDDYKIIKPARFRNKNINIFCCITLKIVLAILIVLMAIELEVSIVLKSGVRFV